MNLIRQAFCIFLVCLLSACGVANNGNNEEENKIIVGASNVPHAEILEEAVPLMKEKGIELEIVPFQDYVLPNTALADKEIDANYFQHIPYLEGQIAEHGYDFVNAGGVHIEPIGVYSKKYKSLDELPDGGTIIMSNSIADHKRILMLLDHEGLIKLKEDLEVLEDVTIDSIAENPKNITFITDVDPGYLPQLYNTGEGDAVIINTNYAIDAGLNPPEDAIAIEGSASPYVNIIAVRSGDEDREEIKALMEVLHSEQIQNFIKEKYKGAVVPVSE